jgi:glycosyltransferase involved in cell wall biosynthesis
MKIGIITSAIPSPQGISIYSKNLLNGLLRCSGHEPINSVSLVSVDEIFPGYQMPDGVDLVIRKHEPEDYQAAVSFINAHYDVCILQHGFNVFGGENGCFIMPLLQQLRIPLVVMFHHLNSNLSVSQKEIVETIGQRASGVVAFSTQSLDLLEHIYKIPIEKIKLMPFGADAASHHQRDAIRKKLGFDGKKVILHFGFLKPVRGVHVLLDALPSVAVKHPDVHLYCLGQTDANELEENREGYRLSLHLQARRSGMGSQVIFDNRLPVGDTLLELLIACDVCVLPLTDASVVQSFSLTQAMAAGAVVVATPFWHAREMLSDGRGELVPFDKPDVLSNTLIQLLSEPRKMELLRQSVTDFGQHFWWANVGVRYLKLLEETVAAYQPQPVSVPVIDWGLMPSFSMDAIDSLTDYTGIVRHADYGIPNLKSGYLLSDNALGLMVAVRSYAQFHDATAYKLIPVYLGFIRLLQNRSEEFLQGMDQHLQVVEVTASEEMYGKTMMALGFLMQDAPFSSYASLAKDVFLSSVRRTMSLESLPAIAEALTGLVMYLKRFPGDELISSCVRKLTQKLIRLFEQQAVNGIPWFEPVLKSSNAMLPLSLMMAAQVLDDEVVQDVAFRAAEYLESMVFTGASLMPIGTRGWLSKTTKRPEFDQLSLEVEAMVNLYGKMYEITGKKQYAEKQFTCYLWFLGHNSLRRQLFDAKSGLCSRGLTASGIDPDKGAEGTLAFWLAYLSVSQTYYRECLLT